MEKILCRPVMLPQTGEIQFPCLCMGTLELGLRYTDKKFGSNFTKYYHLYLVSDLGVEKDEWVIFPNTLNGEISNFDDCIPQKSEYPYAANGIYNLKIEATTDKSLGLPVISDEWMRKVYHPNHSKIEKVYIEGVIRNAIYYYNVPHNTGQPDYDWTNIPKEMAGYRDQIIISPITDLYPKDREELESILMEFSYDLQQNKYGACSTHKHIVSEFMKAHNL